ncbi:hypothetical protein EJ05DRAFT_472706 [Pseudovirgaria hyperparasitica]|uniref:DNA polymerase lambda n=1 Tax=Pseudovirgaria hyperparasitica TaxID=470096 RepID=A0A6A6WJ29_9PEZI|nr:uncharacterized protein EJ05DRAFT_472706 [Pseudovirgaria hyperparasitica]KAF2761737.1 hypothetical protein EJ05DRAFT_472706 [Pseudovirgaria hyperparasitica]
MFDFSPDDKKKFYEDLENLDKTDSEREDEGHLESIRLLRGSPTHLSTSRGSFTGRRVARTLTAFDQNAHRAISRESSSRHFPLSLIRSQSEPQPMQPQISLSHPREKSVSFRHLGLKKSASSSSLSSREMAPASKSIHEKGKGKKRSRPTQEIQLAQIFQGLVFFFVPNNTHNNARRMRIELAQKRGAIWAKEWSTAQITHVIADKDVKYAWLLSHLNLTEIPSNISVVSEHFIPDSIAAGLQDPARPRYRIEGQVVQPPNRTAVELPAESDRSLQVKPAKKDVSLTGPDTQSTVVASSIGTAVLHDALNDSTRASKSNRNQAQYNDELAQVIKETKPFAHLPLSDESDDAGADQPDDLDHEEGPPRKAPRLDIASEASVDKWQKSFQCMHKNEGNLERQNPNAYTIGILSEMAQYYDNGHDDFRLMSYRRAVASLQKCDTLITTKDQALKLGRVGPSIAEKIEEIVTTKGLRKLENAKSDPREVAIQLFLRVYGCGKALAEEWYAKGYRTLEDLEKEKLTSNQRIGVDHYEDFNTRIPRAEVEAHGKVVMDALEVVAPGYKATIMGSYRRGTKDCGDIDMLITKENTAVETVATVVFEQLVPYLTETGFLVASLATPHANGGTKWHGASLLPASSLPSGSKPLWRRIDFLVVPESEMGAALLYFTGDDIFNRSMRLLASKKKMRLNQRGLYKDVIRGPNRERLTEGTLVEGKSEQGIFEALGVPYRPPHHRICG